MAYADLTESYIIVTIIVIVKKSQKNEDILVRVFSALDVEDNLSLLDWIWAISDEKRSSVVIIIN